MRGLRLALSAALCWLAVALVVACSTATTSARIDTLWADERLVELTEAGTVVRFHDHAWIVSAKPLGDYYIVAVSYTAGGEPLEAQAMVEPGVPVSLLGLRIVVEGQR